ncbi:hypothetical protein BJ508DRAFT_357263 [Ascobolus immersus RN42]|uniref:Uncharacterized protein n=1 Tax=Ascobolus immersus RN42 TaxID=1160509 RepID=A0A3N4ITV9_ASCIM|nr:hypothetical protein BJ508DRAFT_357263 [Ascobolus immersus RN42]
MPGNDTTEPTPPKRPIDEASASEEHPPAKRPALSQSFQKAPEPAISIQKLEVYEFVTRDYISPTGRANCYGNTVYEERIVRQLFHSKKNAISKFFRAALKRKMPKGPDYEDWIEDIYHDNSVTVDGDGLPRFVDEEEYRNNFDCGDKGRYPNEYWIEKKTVEVLVRKEDGKIRYDLIEPLRLLDWNDREGLDLQCRLSRKASSMTENRTRTATQLGSSKERPVVID